MKPKVLPLEGVSPFPSSAVKWKDEVRNRKACQLTNLEKGKFKVA